MRLVALRKQFNGFDVAYSYRMRINRLHYPTIKSASVDATVATVDVAATRHHVFTYFNIFIKPKFVCLFDMK